MVKALLSHWRLCKDVDSQDWDTMKEIDQRCQMIWRYCWKHWWKRMRLSHHRYPMVLSIVRKQLRKALIAIFTTETTRKGITSLNIWMFILITIMLLTMDVNHYIKKHVLFVVYITIYLLSVGRESQHERGWGMKGLLHHRGRNMLRRSLERRISVVISTEVVMKRPHVEGSI